MSPRGRRMSSPAALFGMGSQRMSTFVPASRRVGRSPTSRCRWETKHLFPRHRRCPRLPQGSIRASPQKQRGRRVGIHLRWVRVVKAALASRPRRVSCRHPRLSRLCPLASPALLCARPSSTATRLQHHSAPLRLSGRCRMFGERLSLSPCPQACGGRRLSHPSHRSTGRRLFLRQRLRCAA
jgi:hypothetical protein